jgi:hypothetical protein
VHLHSLYTASIIGTPVLLDELIAAVTTPGCRMANEQDALLHFTCAERSFQWQL